MFLEPAARLWALLLLVLALHLAAAHGPHQLDMRQDGALASPSLAPMFSPVARAAASSDDREWAPSTMTATASRASQSPSATSNASDSSSTASSPAASATPTGDFGGPKFLNGMPTPPASPRSEC